MTTIKQPPMPVRERAILMPFDRSESGSVGQWRATPNGVFRPLGIVVFPPDQNAETYVTQIRVATQICGFIRHGRVPAWFFNGKLGFAQLDKIFREEPPMGEDFSTNKVLTEKHLEFIRARQEQRCLFDFPTMHAGMDMAVETLGPVQGVFAWGNMLSTD